MRFSTRLMILFTALFLVSSVVVISFVYSSNVHTLGKLITEHLEARTVQTMDKLDRFLAERLVDLKIIASDPIISTRSAPADKLTERLDALQEIYPFYASISLFDLNGVRLADTSERGIGRRMDFGRHRDELKTKGWTIFVDRSLTLDRLIIFCMRRVTDANGAPFAVLVTRVPVDDLDDMFRHVAGMTGAEIDLVDKSGRIIYSNHQGKDRLLQEPINDWPLVSRQLAAGRKSGSLMENHHRDTGEREREILVFAQQLGHQTYRGSGWTLVADIPARTAFAPAIELRNRLILFLFASGIAILIGIFVIARAISSPIRQLSGAAAEIGRGNLDVTVDTGSQGELGELAEAFNTMAVELGIYRARLLRDSALLEQTVAERTAELESAKDAAQAASLAKSDFIANMSHEIRTPLTAIIGFAELLRDELNGPPEQRLRSYAEQIITSGIRLQNILTDILDMSQVGFDKAELNLNSFPVKDVIIPIIDIFRLHASQRGIALEFEPGPADETVIIGDPAKLKKAIGQLVDNALKFTPEGGRVSVHVQRGGVAVNGEHPLESRGGPVEIAVEDTGIGLKPEQIPNLFTLLSQIERPYTKRFPGTGIGLFLAKKLIEMHGGGIRVESTFGTGSRFIVSIPVGATLELPFQSKLSE